MFVSQVWVLWCYFHPVTPSCACHAVFRVGHVCCCPARARFAKRTTVLQRRQTTTSSPALQPRPDRLWLPLRDAAQPWRWPPAAVGHPPSASHAAKARHRAVLEHLRVQAAVSQDPAGQAGVHGGHSCTGEGRTAQIPIVCVIVCQGGIVSPQTPKIFHPWSLDYAHFEGCGSLWAPFVPWSELPGPGNASLGLGLPKNGMPPSGPSSSRASVYVCVCIYVYTPPPPGQLTPRGY